MTVVWVFAAAFQRQFPVFAGPTRFRRPPNTGARPDSTEERIMDF
jgi:hypothetical protein